jgi:hypothetical protein
VKQRLRSFRKNRLLYDLYCSRRTGRIAARKLIDVAANHTDATFVALNNVGAGGLVALKAILDGTPDGYYDPARNAIEY